MDLRIFTEPQQGASYDQLLAVALTAEECGFSAFFRSDHYMKMGNVAGLPGSTDAWITLAGLARDTSRIRLGTLLTASTFRLPGVLAISVAQVDAMSGGRVELGLGAAWFEAEHAAYGIPFPGTGERFARLDEQLAIITGLWTTPADETFSYEGSHFQLQESPALPKSQQKPRPPVIVGGSGAKKTPRLAAKYADEFNFAFRLPELHESQFKLIDQACEAIGRDPSAVLHSGAQVVCCGSDAGEVARRAGRIGREPDEMRTNGLCGSPAEIIDKLGVLRQAGVVRCYLQVLDLDDLDHIRLLAAEVLPAVADL